jgi:hypothetical protein
LLLLAGTEDHEQVLHPELMLTTMTDSEARHCVQAIKRSARAHRDTPLMQTPQWSAREILETVPF